MHNSTIHFKALDLCHSSSTVPISKSHRLIQNINIALVMLTFVWKIAYLFLHCVLPEAIPD